MKGFLIQSYSRSLLHICPVRRSHGCRADTLTLVSEALIDQSMVMAKTGLEVWLDLLGAIGRLGSMGFLSARGHGLRWTCGARIILH